MKRRTRWKRERHLSVRRRKASRVKRQQVKAVKESLVRIGRAVGEVGKAYAPVCDAADALLYAFMDLQPVLGKSAQDEIFPNWRKGMMV